MLLQATMLFPRIPKHPPVSSPCPSVLEQTLILGLHSRRSLAEVWLTSDSKYGARMSLINVQVKRQQKHSTSHCCSADLL